MSKPHDWMDGDHRLIVLYVFCCQRILKCVKERIVKFSAYYLIFFVGIPVGSSSVV